MRAKAKSRAFVYLLQMIWNNSAFVNEFIAMGFSLHVSSIGKDRAQLMMGKEMIFPSHKVQTRETRLLHDDTT